MRSVKEFVFCEPAANKGIEHDRSGGFTQILTKKSLQKMKLIVDSDFLNLKAGSFVYVSAEVVFTQPWGKNVFKVQDQDAISVPTASVVGYEEA